jgi:hypothetical protein
MDLCHAGTSLSDHGKHENHYLADHGPRVTTIFHARHHLLLPKWTGHVIESHRERPPKLSSSLTTKYVPDGLGRPFSPPSTLFLESRVHCRCYVTSCGKWTFHRAHKVSFKFAWWYHIVIMDKYSPRSHIVVMDKRLLSQGPTVARYKYGNTPIRPDPTTHHYVLNENRMLGTAA